MISPEILVSDYKNASVIVTPTHYSNEICRFLVEQGFVENQIYTRFIADIKEQYFDTELISLSPHEVFVDCGVFNGETSIEFSHFSKGEYDHIYLFEANEEFAKDSQSRLEERGIEHFTLFPVGLWSQKETLSFGGVESGFGVISDINTIHIPVDSMEAMLGDTPVTFIKMDIEGAELKALEGAKNLISKNKPKLAISLYHKPEDLYEIPLFLKELVPEYRFYLRHYSSCWIETVLYAVV